MTKETKQRLRDLTTGVRPLYPAASVFVTNVDGKHYLVFWAEKEMKFAIEVERINE